MVNTHLETRTITANNDQVQSIVTDCLDILIKNFGAGTVLIDNYPLLSGETVIYSANEGEVIRGELKINFLGSAGKITYTRRTYGK